MIFDMDKRTLQAAVIQYLTENNLSQNELAEMADVSQPAISRAVNGNWKMYSRSLRKVGQLVGIAPNFADPRGSDLLMNALGRLWDGSPTQEKQLAEFLTNVADLKVL